MDSSVTSNLRPLKFPALAADTVHTAANIRALAGLLLVNLVMYAVSAYYVNVFYTHNLPHFDSIGPLTKMYEFINLARGRGAWAAWVFARQYDSVSWVQSAYAILLSPLLPRTPSAMMGLNFACLFAAQAALFDLGRKFGASRLQAFGFGLLPLMPALLHGHYGTYQDMRRDASFLCLLLVAYCLSLTYLHKPAPGRGILLGVVAGLTLLSRGNALPYLAIALLPAIVWAAARYVVGRKWRELLFVAATPLIPCALLVASYYRQSVSSLLFKYLYNTPDLGTTRMVSLAHFGPSPAVLLLGEPGRVFALKLALLLIGLPALVLLGLQGRELTWQPRRAFAGDRRWLAIGGAVALVGTLALVTLVVGVSPIAGYYPSYPVLISLFSLLAALSLAVSFRDGRLPARNKRLLAVAVALVFTFANSIDSLRLSTYPRQTANVRTARELVPLLRALAPGRKVTWVWDGNLNYWVVNYYLSQAGEPPLQFFYPVSLDRLPSPALGETVESRAAEIEESLRSADVLVLSDTPGAYTGIIGPGFFDTYGYLIVPDLLADPRFEQVYDFESDGYHFVILQRIEPSNGG